MSVSLDIVDERSVTLKRGQTYSEADTEQIGKLITNAAQDGYVLATIEEVKESDYRESWFGGVKLVFRRRP